MIKNTLKNKGKSLKLTTLGFTLIELLAVIVILAIIALIATPIVLSIIDDTKKSSMLRSAEMYLNGVENSIMKENMNEGGNYRPNDCTITNGLVKCDDYEGIAVEVDGELPQDGSTIKFENGKIVEVRLVYKSATIVMDEKNNLVFATEEETVVAKTLSTMCTLADGSTANTIGAKYSCDFGAGAKNFYILELGTNPVSNTTLESDEVALILEGNYDTTTQYWCDQSGANSRNNVCAADGLTSKLDEIAGAWTELERDQIGLPSMEQIMLADGQSEDAYTDFPSLSNAWLYNWPDNADYGRSAPYGYWSSSPDVGNSVRAWRVTFYGSVGNGDVYYGVGNGVRPVITLKI